MAAESPRPVYFNLAASSWTAPQALALDAVRHFHETLPGYRQTPLVSLDTVAKELGVGAVYAKDESDRFGLPSFKILGASWAIFRKLTQELNLGPDTELESLRVALATRPIPLFAATEGNHGRAVARLGALLSVPVEIYVPAGTHSATMEPIRSEGASVVVSTGDYDVAMREASEAAIQKGGVLIQDCGFGSYQRVPQLIVEGYQTMFSEIDAQLGQLSPSLVVTPVGVGSLAQAVVSHFKRQDRAVRILTVEPDTAACLWKSLARGESVTERTMPGIMAGLTCGTVSSAAWSILQPGVDASVSVSDYESHLAVEELKAQGLSIGPCGAATLAGLRRLKAEEKTKLGLGQNSVIILLCTEGKREYSAPRSVSTEDPIALTQTLIRIDSANASLGPVAGPGETEIAEYIRSWLEHRNIETSWIEPTPRRPSIVGVVRGTGGGKSLMFNGHIDTVTNLSYDGDPLSGELRDGKIYGRGSADMKSGIAAAMVALARARKLQLRGDVIFTGVADEEDASIGTEQVLAAGWRADGAIVSEPTNLEIHHVHKGFVWVEVDIHGKAAHGSRPDLGVDAIAKAGYFLAELDRYGERLRKDSDVDSPVGPPSLHAGVIKGGEEPSSYPAICTVTVEYRTVAGETPETVASALQAILDKLSEEVSDFRADLRVVFSRSSFCMPLDHPFAELVAEVVARQLGRESIFSGGPFWTDCALLDQQGIPVLLWGTKGQGLHSREEYVEADSIVAVADGLASLATEFCK
ncbi:acetylornithine deacetylase [Thozetella sp. PMI_491]|nr:acetylornithine deacetylase [Thozetella sp. PMI_491]